MTGGVWCIVSLWYVISLSVIIITRKICVQQAHTVWSSVGDITAVVGMVGVINKCSADIRSVLAVHLDDWYQFDRWTSRLTRRNDTYRSSERGWSWVYKLTVPSPKWFSGAMPNVRNIKNKFIALNAQQNTKLSCAKITLFHLILNKFPQWSILLENYPNTPVNQILIRSQELHWVSGTTLATYSKHKHVVWVCFNNGYKF